MSVPDVPGPSTYNFGNTDGRGAMPCVDGEVDINSPPNSTAATGSPQSKIFAQTPEKGRVWRRRKATLNSKKSAEGPVLRATVKPVKRFRPETSPDAGSSVAVQPTLQTPVKRCSEVLGDDTVTSDTKSNQPQPAAEQVPPTKKKRVREQWSIGDKNHFFDAVAIHGKDFEAVQKTIAQKHKKKGDETAVKTKDQVRHLYYRTWTSISKLLGQEGHLSHFSKTAQELIAIINFGELRRKLGGYILKKKEVAKLIELIQTGSTSIRVKGKTCRIKTPACKALKQVLEKEGATKKLRVTESRRVKLPVRVNIDLHPLTMHAWNKVHLLAHNPRLRFSIPLDCQLSHMINYLTKKWRALSDKMFEVAELGHIAPPHCSPAAPSCHEEKDDTLEIHVPPESSVKSNVDVHQVVSSKTHCMVHYSMCKPQKPVRTKKKEAKLPTPPEAKENLAIDTCNSSEDECTALDHLSDSDMHNDDAADCRAEPGKPTDNGIAFDRNCVLAPAIENGADDGVLSSTPAVAEGNVAPTHGAPQNVSGAFPAFPIARSIEDSKIVDAFQQETDICADSPDFESCTAADSTDSCASADSMTSPTDVSGTEVEQVVAAAVKVSATMPLHLPDTATTSSPVFSTATSTVGTIDCKATMSRGDASRKEYVALLSLNSPPLKPNVDAPLSTGRNSPASKPEKRPAELANAEKAEFANVPDALRRSWSHETSGNVTLAEIYLMLGKPSQFKLCYEWIRKSSIGDGSVEKQASKTEVSFSSGLSALVQAAALLKAKLQRNESPVASEVSKKPADKASNSSKKFTHVGVQCTTEDKVASVSSAAATATSSSAKKHHGRGVSKFTMPVTNVEMSDGFAVPSIPALRRQKAFHSIMEKSDVSPNPDEIRQKVQERVGDARFRRQMEALNRRMDLFRSHNRNRATRPSYVVQRTLMPNDGAVRKMMTLSIVSCGANKVGFAPQLTSTTAPIRALHPDRDSESARIPECNVSSSQLSPDASSTDSSSEIIGRALGMKILQQGDPKDSVGQPNLLAMAAREAAIVPSTPEREVHDESATCPSDNELSAARSSQSFNQPQEHSERLQPPSSTDFAVDSPSVATPAPSVVDSEAEDPDLQPRPITPSMDTILESFDVGEKSIGFPSHSTGGSPEKHSTTPLLVLPALDVSPLKLKPSSPANPWMSNYAYPDSPKAFATLNTPQRVYSDNEDSQDSVSFSPSKRLRMALRSCEAYNSTGASGSVTSSLVSDSEMDVNLQSLINDNSVDLVAKFQYLIQQQPAIDDDRASQSARDCHEAEKDD